MPRLIEIQTEGATARLRFDCTEIETTADSAAFAALVGMELSDEEFASLLDKLSEKALAFGARMLGMRAMTRKMLFKRMLEKGYDESLAEHAIGRLESMRAIDDLDYAGLFVRDRQARGWGAGRIRTELLSRGVERDIVEQVLEELDDPEEKIEEFVRSKLRGAMDEKQKKRIIDGLARRGFSWEDISPVIRRIEQELEDEYDEDDWEI